MDDERKPDGPIENYIEWSKHRYDPGHYLGGTLPPHLRKNSLGPRARRLSGLFLLFSGLGSVLLSFAAGGVTQYRWLEALLASGWSLLFIAAGLAMLASSRSSARDSGRVTETGSDRR
jgi:hypothetical protein